MIQGNGSPGGVSLPPQQRKFNKATGVESQGPNDKLAKKVKAIITKEIEIKAFDVPVNYTNVGASGNVGPLTFITLGTGASQRIGDTVRLKYIEIRVAGYQNNTTSVQFPNIVRVILFRWNQYTNVSAPSGTSVLQVAALGTIGTSICSPYADTTQRSNQVQVLHDSYHFTSLNSNSFAFLIRQKLDSEVVFAAGTTDGRGHLYLMINSDDAGVVSPCPSVAYYSRVSYID